MIFIQVVVTSGRRAIRPSRPWKRCCFGVTGAFRGVGKNIRLNSWVFLWKWGRIDLNIFYLKLRLGLLPLKIRCEHSNRGFNMIQTCTKRTLDFTGKRRFPVKWRIWSSKTGDFTRHVHAANWVPRRWVEDGAWVGAGSTFLMVKSPFLMVKSPFLMVKSPFLMVKSLQFLWWSYPNFWWFNCHFRWLDPCFLILTFFFWVDDMLMDDCLAGLLCVVEFSVHLQWRCVSSSLDMSLVLWPQFQQRKLILAKKTKTQQNHNQQQNPKKKSTAHTKKNQRIDFLSFFCFYCVCFLILVF